MSARTFDVHRALGPNPSPVVGSVRARGTSGLVAAHNGELSIERTDLELPTRRGTLRFTRSYRGQDRVPGPFGLGWSHSFGERIAELSPELAPPSGPVSRKLMLVHRDTGDTVLGEHDVIHHDGLGNAVHYKAHPEGELPESYSTDPIISAWASSLLRVYTPEPGVYDALVKMKSGHFVRVTPDGMQHWFGPTGRLEKIYDRFEANWQHLVYTSLGELRAIVDRSVEVPRRYELGYYRGPSDPVFTPGLDEHTSSLHKAGLVRRLKDSAGREVLYSYDAHNRLVQVEEAMGGGQTRRLEYGYGNDDRLHTVVDGSVSGRPLLTAEGAMQSDGRITRVDGPRGRVLFTYAHENLARAMGVGSETHLLFEDGASERLRLNPRGLVERKTSSGPVSGVEVREFGYHDDVVLRSVRAPRGNIETLEYERDLGDDGLKALRSQGNVRSITRSPGGSGAAQTSARQYDRHYNLPSGTQTDFFQRTEFVSLVPPSGKSVLAVTKGGESTTFVTDPETGQLRAEVSTTGVDAAYEYHPTRAHVVEATIGGVTTRYGYETCGAISDLGLPCTVTPAASLPVEYTYTRGGFLETLRKGGYELSYRYSPFGDLERAEESVEPGRYRIQTWAHDDLGQVLAETSEAVETFTAPAGEPLTTTYRRDLLGRVEEVIAADGTETRLSYDHQDRVHTVTTGAYSEAYFYDTNGNLERQEVGDAITRWSYDGLDRLTGVADAEGGHLSLSYRPNGDPLRTVLTQVDRADFGVLAQVDYVERDAFGRSRGHQLGGRPDATYHVVHQGREMNLSGPGGLSETYTWDRGLRPKLSNRAGVFSTDRSYDLEGRLETVSHLAGGRDYGGSLSYTPLGDLEIVNDARGDLRTHYAHRLDGAVTGVTEVPEEGGDGLTTEIGRSVLGEPLSERRANGVTTEVTLDGQRRVRSWGLQSGVGRQYLYDQANRLTGIVYRDGSQMNFGGFDARNRPEDITIPGGSMQASYDRLGRPVGLVTSFGGLGSNESVVYDALDRARQVTSDAGTIRYEYDSLGVLEQTEFSSEGRTYTLDVVPTPTGVPSVTTYPSRTRLGLGREAGQRLSSIRDLSSSAAGEVIADQITYATPTKLGSMKLGPSGLVREDVYDERQRLRSRVYRTAAETVAELRYTYDGADREVARQYGHRGHRTDLYVYDDGGRLVRADLAARVVHPDNAPLTAPVHGWDVSPSQGPQMFQSHFWDGDVGLYHMRARMFDPRSGTFLSRDPSGYVDSVNLYAPMRWDVVNLRDPTGSCVWESDPIKQAECWDRAATNLGRARSTRHRDPRRCEAVLRDIVENKLTRLDREDYDCVFATYSAREGVTVTDPALKQKGVDLHSDALHRRVVRLVALAELKLAMSEWRRGRPIVQRLWAKAISNNSANRRRLQLTESLLGRDVNRYFFGRLGPFYVNHDKRYNWLKGLLGDEIRQTREPASAVGGRYFVERGALHSQRCGYSPVVPLFEAEDLQVEDRDGLVPQTPLTEDSVVDDTCGPFEQELEWPPLDMLLPGG